MTKKILSALTIIFFSFSTYAVEVDANHIAKSRKAMITTNGQKSTVIGYQILKSGGNAVDASIAVSFALSVELIDALGIGGGGFSLLSLKGEKLFYDFRERAPAKASTHMYKDTKEENNAATGPLSVAIPGLVKGLEQIHQKHGSLPWKDLVQPAINMASEGIIVDARLLKSINIRKKFMSVDPELRTKFLDEKGEPLPIGTKIVLNELAMTLESIRDQGSKAFYEGAFPAKVVQRLGKAGILQVSDFSKYEVKTRKPLVGKYKDLTFYTAPSPSSGGVVITQLFNMLNNVDMEGSEFEQRMKIIEMFKASFFDRAKYMGDSDFVKIPEELTTPEYAKKKAELINTQKNISYDPKSTGEDDIQTAHFNIVDTNGDVVSSTITHNYYFGSGISVNGVVLNDEMDDFASSPGVANKWGLVGSYKNSPAPFKTPLSSMSPTIVEKDGKFVMSIGGRGGSQIITVTFLVIDRVLNKNMSPKKAVEDYYYHHQTFPNVVTVEKTDKNKEFVEYLKSEKYETEEKEIEKWWGKVNFIYKKGKNYIGVTDPREPGKVLGY